MKTSVLLLDTRHSVVLTVKQLALEQFHEPPIHSLLCQSSCVFNPETVVCSLQGKWERRPLATVVRVTPPSSLELSSRPSAIKPKRRVFPQGEVLFSNVTQRHLTGLGPYGLESTAAGRSGKVYSSYALPCLPPRDIGNTPGVPG